MVRVRRWVLVLFYHDELYTVSVGDTAQKIGNFGNALLGGVRQGAEYLRRPWEPDEDTLTADRSWSILQPLRKIRRLLTGSRPMRFISTVFSGGANQDPAANLPFAREHQL